MNFQGSLFKSINIYLLTLTSIAIIVPKLSTRYVRYIQVCYYLSRLSANFAEENGCGNIRRSIGTSTWHFHSHLLISSFSIAIVQYDIIVVYKEKYQFPFLNSNPSITEKMSSDMQKQHPQSVHGATRDRKYGAFQNEIYREGMFANSTPTVTTDPNKLEEQARSKLAATSYNYVAGGAGEKATMDANRLAFRQWKMVPRMLRPTTKRDLRVNLFGQEYESPILMAPVGVQKIFHDDKETGLSEVCAELGVPYILSTASSSSIEEVAESNGPNGHRWYQLYWPQDDEITVSLLQRAKASGYKVLVVTLDTWALSWRPADLDGGYVPFMRGVGDKTGFTDPVFRRKFQEKFHATPEEKLYEASLEWVGDIFSGAAHTWDQIKLLKDNWDGPIVLKGIQHPDDAREAVKAGVDGIVVSNHGGRQLDGAVGSLEMLPEIVEAVGDKLTILFDSGIRTGVDVIKALSLGAKAVLVGRPAIYGLAVGGKQGAKQVLQGILADVDQSMGLAGIQDIKGCNRSMLRRVQYGGDVKANN